MTTIFQRVTLSYYKKNKHALHFHRLRGYHLASHSPKAARHAILTKATKRISSGCSGSKASSKPDDKQAQQEEQQEEKKQQGNSSKAGTAKGHDAAKEYGPGKKKARTENVWLCGPDQQLHLSVGHLLRTQFPEGLGERPPLH